MRHVEAKRFTFNRPPTGFDVVELIKDNELYGWKMDIVRRLVETNNMTAILNPYVYDVTFEKDVEK